MFLGGYLTSSTALISSLEPSAFLARHTYVPLSALLTGSNFRNSPRLRVDHGPIRGEH